MSSNKFSETKPEFQPFTRRTKRPPYVDGTDANRPADAGRQDKTRRGSEYQDSPGLGNRFTGVNDLPLPSHDELIAAARASQAIGAQGTGHHPQTFNESMADHNQGVVVDMVPTQTRDSNTARSARNDLNRNETKGKN